MDLIEKLKNYLELKKLDLALMKKHRELRLS